MRRTVVLGCGAVLAMGLLTGPANAASAPGSCPTAFVGPVTFAGLVTVPQIDAGLDAGVYTLAQARAVFDAADHNRDLGVCWISTGNGDQFRSMYAVNIVDNNAAPKDPK